MVIISVPVVRKKIRKSNRQLCAKKYHLPVYREISEFIESVRNSANGPVERERSTLPRLESARRVGNLDACTRVCHAGWPALSFVGWTACCKSGLARLS